MPNKAHALGWQAARRHAVAKSGEQRCRDTTVTKQELLYIELKSGHGDCGPAWIGHATLSKTGRTVYFNGRALKRSGGQGVSGNHYCLETGDEYWVSGVKRDGCDRHWAGSGPIMIDARVVAEYLAFRGLSRLDPTHHRIVSDIQETDIAKFHDLENQTL